MTNVDKITDNLKRCLCAKCPTYTLGCKVKELPGTLVNLIEAKGDPSRLEHLEGMYCAYEKSHCIEEEKGCLCKGCKVHQDYDLANCYFCRQTGGYCTTSEG